MQTFDDTSTACIEAKCDGAFTVLTNELFVVDESRALRIFQEASEEWEIVRLA